MKLLNWMVLLKVFWNLETGANMHPPANGDCVGPFQLATVFVQDANRIAGKQKYQAADREDYWKSQEMVLTVLQYYFPKAKATDLWRVVLTFRCGVHGANTPNGEQLDYAKRATNLYKDFTTKETK